MPRRLSRAGVPTPRQLRWTVVSASECDMDNRRRPSFSVFEQFRSFWQEVQVLRAAALAPAMAPAGAPAATTALAQVSTATRERLLSTLRGQQADLVRRANSAVVEYYRQAQYVM